MAVEIQTVMGQVELKQSLVACVEKTLHRVRTEDKNAPRTIDLDIMIFNGKVVDQDVWKKAFAAIPVSELEPALRNDAGDTLYEVAKQLKSSARAELFSSQ